MMAFVVGTTAELIKVIPVMKLLADRQVHTELWSTGQQPQDLEKALGVFETRVDLELAKGIGGRNLSRRWDVAPWLSGLVIRAITDRSHLRKRLDLGPGKPVIVVHGDTMTAAYGSVLSRWLNVDLVHIEAGLRSGSILRPFPEELVRRLVATQASINFAPNDKARGNLASARGRTVVTKGNTVVDSLRLGSSLEPTNSRLTLPPKFILVSLHRSELLGDRDVLRWTYAELAKCAALIPIVLVQDSLTDAALHRSAITEHLVADDLLVMDKQPYPDFLRILMKASAVITDSGGLQEECAILGIPCLIHRTETERDDGLAHRAELSRWKRGALVGFAEKWSAEPSMQRSFDGASPSEIIVETLAAEGYF